MTAFNTQVLVQAEADKLLKKQGYVVLPFLNDEEVSELKSVFLQIKEGELTDFYATAHAKDIEFRRKMSEYVRKAFQRSFDLYFENYQLLGGSFITKRSHSNQILQPHQDWNIVDENRFRSYNIWVPLLDLNETNGAIQVLPGSHNWLPTYRHASIPCVFEPVHPLILTHMLSLHLKAGEALIYDHALLHASEANVSETDRIACACGTIPKDAPMQFYWNNDGNIEAYASSPDFFMSEDVFSGPHGLQKLENLAYEFPRVNEIDFYKLSGIIPPVEDNHTNDYMSDSPTKKWWQIYTPINIIREIKFRLIGK